VLKIYFARPMKTIITFLFFAIVSAAAQERPNDLVRFSNPATMSQPTAYSHIAEVRGGRMIFLSGQVSQDTKGNVVGKGDIRAQTRQVYANLKAALEAVGGDWSNVVKMTTYLTDAANIAPFREVREEVLANVKPRPASTAVVVSKLFGEEWLLEIEAVAVIPDKPQKTKKK
jgi:enamine deaminase RidA (YjgF/YER057c/UK114 family)